MRRNTALLLAFGGLMGFSIQGSAEAPTPALAGPASLAEYVAVERFLSEIEKPPVANQARRRLAASSSSLNESAWMEVFTDYDPASGFQYQVLAHGGSARIRNRVLTPVLEAEKKNSSKGEWRKGNLSRINYEFNFNGRTPSGMLRMELSPRRRDSRLVNGSALLTAESGDLVRVEGRLAKSPSFWVRWVQVRRSFSPMHGTMMPVAVESIADVKIAGLSTFEMTYDYQMVDGHAISISPQILASR